MDPYLAQVIMFGGNFCPRNWACCDGQILSIAQNTALFALIGTIYGGNGQTTFALPDFRGRIPVGTGNNISLGETGGSINITLTSNNMPAHSHQISTIELKSGTANATQTSPVNNVFANTSNHNYAPVSTANGFLGGVTGTTGQSGSSQPFDIHMPYLGLNFIICIEGIFPSRN